ncbi:GNAT family N-acetyltransferase [Maribacter sp. ACAM166]|uniref:GNAT family N-acetyltransferase n=1 Tax=Maribacter sp. ACAM166 TaxID=2508996 RepID=UPI0010FEFCEF|nr:GNAT family N-acetyltransferase [Maribacter sp. ACAM166]TLP80423.1 GNAT family N-acetyltransferase [Maribacter sp. ACAM166]
MNDSVLFELLVPNLYDTYIGIGTIAYNEHYRHLWPNGDTSTYIENSFTKKVLLKEELDQNTSLYLIRTNKSYAGILKITLDKAIDKHSKRNSLYIDKIYIQNKYTRLGIGRKTLEFVTTRAKELSKSVIYLEAMQKGLALPFYLSNDFTIIGNTKIPFKNAIEVEKPMYTLLKYI